MVIVIPSASTVQGVARTSREGDRVERAAVNSELDHPPERGVPYYDIKNVATTTLTNVDQTPPPYSLADMAFAVTPQPYPRPLSRRSGCRMDRERPIQPPRLSGC